MPIGQNAYASNNSFRIDHSKEMAAHASPNDVSQEDNDKQSYSNEEDRLDLSPIATFDSLPPFPQSSASIVIPVRDSSVIYSSASASSIVCEQNPDGKHAHQIKQTSRIENSLTKEHLPVESETFRQQKEEAPITEKTNKRKRSQHSQSTVTKVKQSARLAAKRHRLS